MREDCVDLWDVEADARVITTNGTVKRNGRAVMGRGCAKQACEKYPFLQIKLGRLLDKHGNHVMVIWRNEVNPYDAPLVCFPVKHTWDQRADLKLITQSAYELVILADQQEWKKVVLPRPGCGNGQRKWREVRPILQPLLDDRFTVVTL